MMRFLRLGLIAALVYAMAACGSQYSTKAVGEGDRWVKKGYVKNDIWRALVDCGYDRSSWNVTQQEAVDKCMLSRGFIFIDSPYGKYHAVCDSPRNQHLPSCQSLK